MASKRGLAIFIFMILTNNVLCTELSHASQTIRQGQRMHNRKTMVPYQQSSTGEKSHEECTRDGDYCFVKKTGYVSDLEILGVLHVNASLSVDDCKEMCKTILCSAFLVFNSLIVLYGTTSGCIYFQTIPDMKKSRLVSFDIYVQITNTSITTKPPAPAPAPAPSNSPTPAPAPTQALVPPKNVPKPADPLQENPKSHWWIWLLGAVAPAIAICFLTVMCYSRTKTAKTSHGKHDSKEEESGKVKSMFALQTQTMPSCFPRGTHMLDEPKKLGDEIQIFRFKSICIATNKFSAANKLGEGGFGPVYKGSLPDGREVAVKRLSRTSSQGMVEFRNEIKLIAKLQHMNLVRLLGCCTEGREKILVYEFLPHKSLDSFLFDPTMKKLLNWNKRLDIIEGTAQGLLYLHKHSRLKVIHRDLKTSNILLDSDLKPKISDFGIARIFEQNTSEANTNRVVGTYGYMSPEYAMAGLYSEKSDVFSFGVIILEIMSGKKATSFSRIDHPLNLIKYAWDRWKGGKSLEIIDRAVSEMYDPEELQRHIHVGLLCVEESATERPTMSDVLSMLTNSTTPLSTPKQPAFYCGKSKKKIEIVHDNGTKNCSPNLVTLSPVEGR